MASFDRLKGVEGRRKRGRILGRKGLESHCYHLMSRTCGGEVWFDEVEKEALARLIGKMSRFCGVEVLTYCVMGNHFHALVRVPDKDQWMGRFDGAGGEEALLKHLGRFYSRSFMESLRWRLDEDRRLGDEAAARGRLQAFRERLCDVSAFMKELKTRFTKWYNRRHGRRGTLWMERFKSVPVEGRVRGGGQRAVDNPVRAGLVKDPAEYGWCGYAAALAGDKALREGLMEVTGQRSWVRAMGVYRGWLLEIDEAGRQEEIAEQTRGDEVPKDNSTASQPGGRHRGNARENESRMSLGELLRCRVRYFSDGAVIGSREFVREHRRRHEQDRRRVPVIRELQAADKLHCMRQLRLSAVIHRRETAAVSS